MNGFLLWVGCIIFFFLIFPIIAIIFKIYILPIYDKYLDWIIKKSGG